MRVSEIIIQETEQLDEIKLKHVLAGAVLGAAIGAGGAGHAHDKYEQHKKAAQVQQAEKAKDDTAKKAADAKKEAEANVAKEKADKDNAEKAEKERIVKLVKIVDTKYKQNIKPAEAHKVVQLAIKHEKPTWKAEDLLALIGIESSFNKNAKSKMKTDPAIGLTQIRPAAWKLHAASLKDNIEKQITKTYDILDHNLKVLGNKEDALHAYNVGLENVKHPDREGAMSNPEYYQKWSKERKVFTVQG